MIKWELMAYYAEIGVMGDVSRIWNKKAKKTGKTQWDDLAELASQGWELVCVTSVSMGGSTQGFLYNFKRPLADST